MRKEHEYNIRNNINRKPSPSLSQFVNRTYKTLITKSFKICHLGVLVKNSKFSFLFSLIATHWRGCNSNRLCRLYGKGFVSDRSLMILTELGKDAV